MQRLDDTDPRITYTPTTSWFMGGVAAEYNSTTHMSNTAGAQMVFQFRGTKVDVYGTITSNLAQVKSYDLFTLDSEDPVEWSVSPQQPAVYQTRMFSSPTLQDGPHVLTLKRYVDKSDTIIDYLEFMPSPSELSSSQSPLGSSISEAGTQFPSSPSVSTATTTVFPSPTFSGAGKLSNSVLPSSVSNSSHLSSGAVAGISIAAMIMVISGVWVLIWQCQKRRRRMWRSGSSGELDLDINPFSQTPTREVRRREDVPKGSPPPYEA
ncbi:hypothetical protein E1B28_010784 [Marasmius oreades]|uniref:Uncharacterized protein n=1 Tax=Marasmius oreades TaxID=181124 RepID=A0A9P7URE2_9AGAR|nr:uncharacterized protein E1B28_010784 [Marasmius oreades]KAG7089074.1 hypothetical protein E1B28_010784 [Marasmius oreades]